MKLELMEPLLAVCRADPGEPIPAWAVKAPFFSVTRTLDELSIVCPESAVPAGLAAETGWRALKVVGPLAFSLTGILANLTAPLAQAKVSIFALSTFDTDYVLVKQDSLTKAIEALRAVGFTIEA